MAEVAMAKNELDITGLGAVTFGEEMRQKEFCLRPESGFINNGSYGTVPRRVLDVQKRLDCSLLVCIICVCMWGGGGGGGVWGRESIYYIYRLYIYI